MTVRKTVAFNAPYIGATFQALADDLVGTDGYLEGAVTTEGGGLGQVAPYKYISRGIVVENNVVTTALVLPTAAEPWFVIASNPDDDISTAVSVRISSDLNEVVGGAVVLAYKTNGSWKNPLPLSALGLAAPRSDSGVLDGFSGFGTIAANAVTAVQVNKGEVVDPSGMRRSLGTSLAPAAAQSFTPIGTFLNLNRTDYAILRQRENTTGEIILTLGDVQGNTQTDPVTTNLVTSATARAPSAVSKRGDLTKSWWAYGDGTALKIAGPIVVTTLLTGAGTIDYVNLVGLRTSDAAVICVYADGNAVKVVAFDSTTGAIIGSAVTIDTQAGACIRISAALDNANMLHVVYQHDEGGAPPNQQIYYVKTSVVIATLGVAVAGTPRLANDVNSTRNDTYPSIAVDRRRRAHITYATGTTSDELGELRYVLIDENGTTVSKTSYSTYGYQPDPHAKKGIVTRAHTSVQRPRIVVTPHDEVYVLGHAIETSSSDAFLVLFSPDFPARLGFAMIQLREFVPYASSASKVLSSFDVMADELGQLQVVSTWGSGLNVLHGRLQTPFAPNGVIGESYNEVGEATLINEAATFVRIAAGPAGGLLYSSIVGTSIKTGLFQSRKNGKRFRPHPKDVVLSAWLIEGRSPATNTIDETRFDVFNTRSKRMNFPFLVGGDDGDFMGFDALHDACADACQRGGAQVIVRSGEYKGVRQLRLDSGVQVRADGLAILEFAATANAAPWIYLNANGASFTVSGISGQVVTLGYVSPQLGRVSPGDVVFMATSGFHRVRRVIESDAASFRVVLDGAAPVGAAAIVYATGIRFENFAIRAASGTAAVMQGIFCIGAVLKNLTFFGSQALQALACVGFRESVLENIDVSGVTVTGTGVGIQMSKGQGNTLRHCRFGSLTSGGGQFKTLASSDEDKDLVLSHCVGPVDASVVYTVNATRTTPLFMHGSRGLVAGDLANVTRELRDTGDTLRGNLVPDTNNSRNLGSSSLAMAEVWTRGVKTDVNNTGSIGEATKTYAEVWSRTFKTDTNNTGSIGEAARSYSEAYIRTIRPDVDNVGGVGTLIRRFATGFFMTLRSEVLVSPQMIADQTDSPAVVPLLIKADPDATAALVNTAGMQGAGYNLNAMIMDAVGNWTHKGNHFIDDFNWDIAPSGVWYSTDSVNGTVVPASTWRSTVSLATGGTINNSAVYSTSEHSAGWKSAEFPWCRARIALGGVITDTRYAVGIIPLLQFVRDTAHGALATSWHIYASISSGSVVDQAVNLSAFSVVAGEWCFMWLGILSTTQYFYGIGEDPDQPDIYGIGTLASAETFNVNGNGVLQASVKTTSAANRELLVDLMEGYSSLRQSVADIP